MNRSPGGMLGQARDVLGLPVTLLLTPELEVSLRRYFGVALLILLSFPEQGNIGWLLLDFR